MKVIFLFMIFVLGCGGLFGETKTVNSVEYRLTKEETELALQYERAAGKLGSNRDLCDFWEERSSSWIKREYDTLKGWVQAKKDEICPIAQEERRRDQTANEAVAEARRKEEAAKARAEAEARQEEANRKREAKEAMERERKKLKKEYEKRVEVWFRENVEIIRTANTIPSSTNCYNRVDVEVSCNSEAAYVKKNYPGYKQRFTKIHNKSKIPLSCAVDFNLQIRFDLDSYIKTLSKDKLIDIGPGKTIEASESLLEAGLRAGFMREFAGSHTSELCLIHPGILAAINAPKELYGMIVSTSSREDGRDVFWAAGLEFKE